MPEWSNNLTSYLENSLTGALENFLNNWENNQTASSNEEEQNVRDILCYLVVMLGMFAFIMVAMLVSTVKSKRREHSNDPYHQYIKEGWTAEIQQSQVIANFAAQVKP
ncbi:potassium voltage-gated channel subfamily E member 2 [Boleophthalmus pectinirostris]|uniref:potassium voltage-gated channel subfamily E member 2 n=1 Tax=Boleophthalmus pectinirostris TaxID=150288 RepID=UPI00242F23C6|nr:potassium voltage-gated channel subfamily E member 2 [Boleophthalmus pectinirostris]